MKRAFTKDVDANRKGKVGVIVFRTHGLYRSEIECMVLGKEEGEEG